MRLIDADNLKRRIKDTYCPGCNSHGGVRCRDCETGDAIDMVETEDTVDHVKHGHWIYVKGSNGKAYDVCSVCGHTQETMGVNNYCPDCGAKMDEKGDC